MPENINDPLAHFVAYLDSERKRQRDNEDAILDQKISFLHDMISTPGANPARTAQALEDMMNLQAGKGGNAPRKKGMAGFMGESVSPQSTILAGLIHGSIPFQGNTTEPIPPPESPYKYMPEQSAKLPPLKNFDGSSVLSEPVMIPPEPLQVPPEASRMLSAARDMQRYNEGPKTRPVANQPMVRSPEEMAQLEGSAEGIKYKSRQKGEREADTESMRELGASDVEIKDAMLRKLGGVGANSSMQDADAGFWTEGDKVVRAVRIFDPRSGDSKLINALTRLPLRPDAQPTAAPSSAVPSQGSPDQQALAAFIKAAEDKKGSPLTPEEKSVLMEKWETTDANRKRSTTTNITRNSQGLTGAQVIQNVRGIQQQWNNHPAVKVINTIHQQNSIMQDAMRQLNDEAKRTGGYLNPASQAILVTFQKILDPNSVVRESEYARSPEGMGLIPRLEGYAQKIKDGGVGMTLGDLKAFAGMAQRIADIANAGTAPIRAQVERDAKLIDPSWTFEDVMGSSTGLPNYPGNTIEPQSISTPLDQKIMDYFSEP